MMRTNSAVTVAVLLTAAVQVTGYADPPRRVEIISLKPNKIVYEDGEAGRATVRLYNPFEEARDVTLRPALHWGLTNTRSLPALTVKVPAQENAAATFPLPSMQERWGHELRVAAFVNDELSDTGRQFFGVSSDWMDLILLSMPRQHYKDQGLLMNEEPFSTYTTVQHWFAWAPGDYAENAPDYDEWYSGQTGYHMVKKNLQETIRKRQEVGVHCTFYNNAFTGGKAGLEWARQHPEWICRERSGKPMLNGSPFMLTKPHTDKSTGKNGQAHMAFYDTNCIAYGVQNVIDSIEMFGWDGMFWDCGGCALFPGFTYDGQPTPHGQAPNTLSARNFRMFHAAVREKYPNFGVWINGAINNYRQPFWSRFGNGGGMDTLEQIASEPQTALLNEFRHHTKPGSTFNRWERCYEVYTENRDAITQRYKVPIIAGYTTFKGWPAQGHLGAMLLATQLRPANCHQEGTWPMTQFMTRYSALLWPEDIAVVAEAETIFDVKLDRPAWWEKLVYRRDSDQGEDIMLHILPKPVTETVDPTVEDAPPPCSGKVTLSLPAGNKLSRVWALQPRRFLPGKGVGLDAGGMPAQMTRVPDPDNPGKTIFVHKTGSLCRGGPSQVELTPVVANGKATVVLPEFIYHTLIVFRLNDASRAASIKGG